MVSLCLYMVRLRLSVSAAKTAIGAAAASLVNDGDTVFIDVGTTTPAANQAVSEIAAADAGVIEAKAPDAVEPQ
jgi:DeoR/GlpR family transcriptional regulator of sugar metabolism